MIGTKRAHYEITSHLGWSGMEEVYQATDTKLAAALTAAESQIYSCESCNPEAEIPFDWILAGVMNRPGMYEFVLSEPAKRPKDWRERVGLIEFLALPLRHGIKRKKEIPMKRLSAVVLALLIA